MDKKPTTQVARLRIDVRTPTRIVRRIVDVSMATQLPKVARILRAARGWTGNRGYTFEIDGRVYRGKAGQQQERETPLRPARERPAGPGGPGRRSLRGQLMADGLRLDDALGETRRFTFIQNVTARRSQVVEVERLGASNEPEEAFPRLVEAVGTLALSELTADDENRRYLIDAQSPRANEQAWAIEMCSDEARRAEVERETTVGIGAEGPQGRVRRLQGNVGADDRIAGFGIEHAAGNAAALGKSGGLKTDEQHQDEESTGNSAQTKHGSSLLWGRHERQ